MKTNLIKIFSIAAMVASVGSIQNLKASDDRVVIYLMDAADYKELSALDQPTDPNDPPVATVPALPPTTEPTTPPAAEKKPKTLDELIKETKATPLTEKQKRVVTMVERDQRDFMKILDSFLKVPFDANDDKAQPEFNKIRDRLVELVMKAPTERAYYERLWLINSYYRTHPDEAFRFTSFDRHYLDRWQSMDEDRRRLQSMILAGTAIVGAAVGGFVTYKVTAKSFAVQATDGILSKLAKWGGRTSFVITGAYIGSMLGRWVGVTSSDFIFSRSYDYLDPVDGTEDLNDLLDDIDPIP